MALFSCVYRKLDHPQFLLSPELPRLLTPSLQFPLRKRCWCVCRVILGLEAISRSTSKAKLISAVTHRFEGVNLAHQKKKRNKLGKSKLTCLGCVKAKNSRRKWAQFVCLFVCLCFGFFSCFFFFLNCH